MKKIYLFSLALVFTSSLFAQSPKVYDIPGRYLEKDSEGRLYVASKEKIFHFDVDGNVLETITPDYAEPTGRIRGFRIGRDGEMYLLYNENNGIYHIDPSTGALTEVLDGDYVYFDVDETGGILASINDGGENILRYSSSTLDTILTLDSYTTTIENEFVYDIQIDNNNTFWIAFERGLLSFKDAELVIHNQETVDDIFITEDDELYVIFGSGEPGYIEPGEDEITPIEGYNGFFATEICSDKDGRIFVASEATVDILFNNEWTTTSMGFGITLFALDFLVDDYNNVIMGTNFGQLFIWKQELTSTKEAANNELMTIYPNPASDFITIANPGGQVLENAPYAVIASNGALVERGTIIDGQIDIRPLPKGIYFIHLEEWGLKLKFVKN